METYITVGLILLAVVLGYYLGSRTHHTEIFNEHYKGMTVLTNQFANLAAQLMNQRNDITLNPPETFEEEEPESDDDRDLTGGMI